MSGTDYKYVIPATPENIEVRLGSIGMDANRRVFLDLPTRARLNLFIRYGFILIVEDLDHNQQRTRIALSNKWDRKLKLSE